MATELRRFIGMIGLVLLALGALPALAGLGGGVDSVQTDGSHMKARVKAAVQGAGYTVQELQLPSGTTVREYVTSGGTVFGVSWSGPTMPDLRQISAPTTSSTSRPRVPRPTTARPAGISP